MEGLGSSVFNYKNEDEGFGAIRAIDPKTGQKKWDFKVRDFTDAGVMWQLLLICCSAVGGTVTSMLWMRARGSSCGEPLSEGP